MLFIIKCSVEWLFVWRRVQSVPDRWTLGSTLPSVPSHKQLLILDAAITRHVLILLARACNYLSRVGLAGHRQSW
jgi:hypothetical protein